MVTKVVLIGGVGCSGKTHLARQLMLSQSIPYSSVDHLMMGLYRSQPVCGFSPDDNAELLAQHLWPIVEAMLKTNLENHHSIAFEGFQLLPKDMASFVSTYPDHCVCLCLGLSAEYIRREFNQTIRQHRNTVERRQFCQEDCDQLIQANQLQKQQCQRYNIAYFEVTDNFERTHSEALAYLERKLGGSSAD